MQIGIGLPNPIPGVDGDTLVEWARRAERSGFSALATIDRVVYPSYESLIALSAAAAVTERISLVTNVLLAPARDTVMLAKQAASVQAVSNGRLVLGLGVGGRPDDFVALDKDFRSRGDYFDRQLPTLHSVWQGEKLSDTGQVAVPQPGRDVPILMGGNTDKAVARTVKWAVGWTAGGGGPDMAAPIVEKVRKAWTEAGREGEPRIVALMYFALGPDADDGANRYLKDYYGFLGPFAEQIAQSAPKTNDDLRDAAARFEDIGVDELVFDPTIGELDQVDRLADAML